MYTPDNWVIFEIELEGKMERFVLAGWSGGYLDGDSWRRNSGIENVTEDENYYYFNGYSGSTYKCHKKGMGTRMNISGVLRQYQDKHGAVVLTEEQVKEMVCKEQ